MAETTGIARKMIDALTGPRHGPRAAWLMARATYAYTRSWDGCEGPDGPMEFSRWYSFCAALECAWWYLWRR